MRRFNLVRYEDISGCSGVGAVAEGVECRSGKVMLSWFPGQVGVQSLCLYDSIDDVIKLHGHDGRTVIEYLDRLHGTRVTAATKNVVLLPPNRPAAIAASV